MLVREKLITKRKPGYYVEVRVEDHWNRETRVVAEYRFDTAAEVENLLDRVGDWEGQQTFLKEIEEEGNDWEGLHIVEVCADGREFVVDRHSADYIAGRRLTLQTYPARYTNSEIIAGLAPVETGITAAYLETVTSDTP